MRIRLRERSCSRAKPLRVARRRTPARFLEREAVDAMTGHEPYSCKAQLPGQSSALVVSDLRGALQERMKLGTAMSLSVLYNFSARSASRQFFALAPNAAQVVNRP